MEYVVESLNAADVIVRPVWSILAKGVTGAGKTIASCGKEFRPVYVFDFEGRFDSVINYYMKLDGHVKDVQFNSFPFTDSSSFKKMDDKMDSIISRPEYKTVSIASLTSFIRMVMVHLQRSNKKNDKGQMMGARMKGGIQVNTLEDYNFEDAAIINQLIGFLQLLKNQGVNVILEAHVTPYDIKTIDETTGEKNTQTIFEVLTKGKKAPAEIPSWFNEVWLFEKIVGGWDSSNPEIKYFINTVGNKTNPCKTSFGIPSFDWTNKDPTQFLIEYLNPELRNTPRVDPNAAKVASW